MTLVEQIEAVDLEPARRAVDNRAHNRRLEVRHLALRWLQELFAPADQDPGYQRLCAIAGGRHTIDRIGTQFGAKLVGAFLKQDCGEAWARYTDLRPTTVGDQMASLLNQGEFAAVHEALHRRLRLASHDIESTIERRLALEIPVSDANEFSGPGAGNLEELRSGGLTVRLDTHGAEVVDQASRRAEGTHIPITELLKNERIVVVSGRSGSKVSLVVHDFIDHLWTWDLLDRAGVLERYGDLLTSIGHPEQRDLRSREGEVIASLAFGLRLFNTIEPGLVPTVGAIRIRQLIEKRRAEACFEVRHEAALAHLERSTRHPRFGLDQPTLESQSLAFVFSNYLTELDEQRRKHGRIKQRCTDGHVRELNPLSLDFLSFFIEAHHQLTTPKNKHLDALAKVQLMIEEFLSDVAGERIDPPFELHLTLDKVASYRPETTRVSFSRARWMLDHYGFAAASKALA